MGPEKAQKYWKEHSDEFDTILVKDDGSILVSEGLAEYFTSESDFTIIKIMIQKFLIKSSTKRFREYKNTRVQEYKNTFKRKGDMMREKWKNMLKI